MTDNELKDFTLLACERARRAVSLVTQLTDDEDAHTTILVAVAMHFIEGAAFHYQLAEEDTDISPEEATAKILMAVITALTQNRGVHKALTEGLRKRKGM